MAKQQNKSKQTIEKEFFEHVRPSSPLKWFAMADEVAAMVAVGSCFPGFRNIARLDCSSNASRRTWVYAFFASSRAEECRLKLLAFVAPSFAWR